MREQFEHLKDSRGMEVTICSLLEEHQVPENELGFTSAESVVAQGISIRNPLDQYNRKRGNTIARGRAYKALRRGKSSGRISPRIKANVGEVFFTLGVPEYKCYILFPIEKEE